MRTKILWVVAAAIVVSSAGPFQAGAVPVLRHHPSLSAPTVVERVGHHKRYRRWKSRPYAYGYDDRYDPYAYSYRPSRYYPYANSGYWRPAWSYRRPRYSHAYPPYAQAWGYPRYIPRGYGPYHRRR